MSVNNSGSSLSSQTTAGAGSAITFTSVCSTHGVQIVTTGFTGSGAATVNLEVSMDNSNWTALPGAVLISGNGTTYWTNGGAPFPALYARARLQALPASVTGISVSAIIASE